MAPKKDTEISTKKTSKRDEIYELNVFIEKKKIQNMALKKIVDKLNSPKNHKNKK